jgi:alpha-tubulin suppressor-like RCC1 family protein
MPADKNGNIQKVKKVICGFRHSMAITENGKLYGWGYNNQ